MKAKIAEVEMARADKKFPLGKGDKEILAAVIDEQHGAKTNLPDHNGRRLYQVCGRDPGNVSELR